MISKIYSIVINGLENDIIEVEVDINKWIPSFTIVWLPDQGVQESRERLRSALKSSNFWLPREKITVNLAPANIKKSGPSFDLSIAMWILSNAWFIEDNEFFKNSVFIWELSLDGSLRWVNSVLPSVIWAMERWFKNIFLPIDNYKEASFIDWINIYWVKDLIQLVNFLNKDWEIINPEKENFSNFKNIWDSKYDFKYIIWQHQARRALEIAAAWMHNIVMSWPPGSWKTMLAKTFSTILSDLTRDEMIEISKIYSVSGLLSQDNPLIIDRPFRTIHHTASAVSIVGWWNKARPWEISLSHKWVLFLDEVLEFPKQVLEVLRQPLEDWEITINRVNSTYTYPANFLLVWATNPCPCWYLSDPDNECICTQDQIKRYRSKLSGPMIDRVDIFIEVPKVKTTDFTTDIDYSKVEDSISIKARVQQAKNLQLKRFKDLKITSNSQMSTKEINKFCSLNKAGETILKQALSKMNLSARAYYRILKLARTIADLEKSINIEPKHIAESLSYRQV